MRPVHVLRVFTDATGEAGNPLGVIGDVTGLTESRMQPIATELGFSETVFIDWRQGGVPSIRIFTPGNELPFAGHPLVGAAWYLNEMGPGAAGINARSGYVEFGFEQGLTWITAPSSVAVVADAPDASQVCAAQGWDEPVSAHSVLMPRRYLMVDMGDASIIDVLEATAEAMPVGLDEAMVYPYARAGNELRSRAFAHAMGIPEDPATGSAATAYAAIRRQEGETGGGVWIKQGPRDAISEIRLVWDEETIKLGGRVVKDRIIEID